MEYDNTNRGVLFLQEQETERHPNFSGNINIDGKEYYLSGWSKTAQTGKKLISLSIKPKEPAHSETENGHSGSHSHDKAPIGATNDEFADEIPF